MICGFQTTESTELPHGLVFQDAPIDCHQPAQCFGFHIGLLVSEVAKKRPLRPKEKERLSPKAMALKAKAKAPLKPRITTALAFVGEQINENKAVLVHCIKGKNRSAAMGVVIRMLLGGSTFRQAVTWLACHPGMPFGSLKAEDEPSGRDEEDAKGSAAKGDAEA